MFITYSQGLFAMTVNQTAYNVTTYCNYEHSLQHYYAKSCTWLIESLFTDMTERAFH